MLKPRMEDPFDADESEPTATSGHAIASLAVGSLFFFAFLSGVPAILFGRQALEDIARSEGRLRGRGLAIGGVALGVVDCFFTLAFLLVALRTSEESAGRAECQNRLRNIGLSVLGYGVRMNRLPYAALLDEGGRPVLSWRVAILSDLDSNSLSQEIQFNEPWDSPHNLRFLADTPLWIYKCPSDTALKPGMAAYQVVVGADTAFTPDYKPVRVGDFTDGLGATLLLSETRQAVPWTKPEDLGFDSPLPLKGLGSRHGSGGFNAVFADNSVRFIKCSIAPGVLDALLTRNGGEALAPGSH